MDQLRQLQLIELDILKEVLSVFEKNHISYFALGGTMLGAVRHKGFIPWDDDIDIGIPREEYERLDSIADQFPEHLKLCSFPRDHSYMYYISRVVDERVTVTSDRTEIKETTPAWIDIFPLDGMPDHRLTRKIHGWHLLARRALFQIARFDQIVNVSRTNRSRIEKIIIRMVRTFHLQKYLTWEKTYSRLDRVLKKYPYAASSYNLNGMGAYKLREMVDKKIFGEGRLYPFEDIQIRGAEDSEAYLTQLYGDWRTPADQSHHGTIHVETAPSPADERQED